MLKKQISLQVYFSYLYNTLSVEMTGCGCLRILSGHTDFLAMSQSLTMLFNGYKKSSCGF